MKQQHEDLAKSQLLEDVKGNPDLQFHRPCQGTRPWLPCGLGKTPLTYQVQPQYHLKEISGTDNSIDANFIIMYFTQRKLYMRTCFR